MARAERKAAAAALAESGGQMSHRQILLVLVGLMSGMFLSALDQSVVGSAMRTIADDLKGLELQAWVTTAYLITSTIATPIYGKLGDIFGRRRLFIWAIALFLLGSILCGFAMDMFQLAAYRAIQGIGAGGLFSLSMTIMADIVPPRERARYQGMFLAVFGSSSVLGPVVGGLFASADQILWVDGWRWVFLINIPVGAVAIFMVLNFLHVPQIMKQHKIDWWGAITIIFAVVPILLVAENGRDWGWTSGGSIAMYVISVVGIVSFIMAERAAGHEALLPLSLFKSRSFTLSTVNGVIIGVAMFGGMMTLPLLLQLVNGATPTESGFMMLPMVFGMMTATILSGQVTRKTGKYKIFMTTGTASMLLGYVYMIGYNADMSYWQVAIGMVLIGFGLGQLMQTLTLVSQQSVKASDIGVATSSATFFRQMGGTLGVAIFISILFNSLGDTIGNAFKDKNILAGIKQAATDPQVMADPNNADFVKQMASGQGSTLGDQIKTDSSFLSKIDPAFARPFKVGFAESATQVFFWASLVIAVAFVLSFFIKAPALRDTSASQEAMKEAAAGSAH